LAAAAAALKGRRVAGLVGDLAPVEAAFALKHLVEGLGGCVECRLDGAKLPPGNRSAYVGTAAIADIDTARSILLIGTDPRSEAPVLNARIRKAWLAGAQVGLIGAAVELTYDYEHLGTGRAALADLVGRVTPRPDALVIVGQGALTGPDGAAVLAAAMAYAEGAGAKLLVLHTAAGRVGAMDVGCTTEGGLAAALDGAETVFALGVDEIDIPAGPTVIYQGHHGDRGAHRADIILPAAAWTEENAIFVNTEGRPQLAIRAAFPPGEAKENWAILRALSGELGRPQPWDDLAALRRALVAAVPHLQAIDEVPQNAWEPLPMAPLGTGDFVPAIADYWLTNPVARASTLMAEMSAAAVARARPRLAAE
jgi:NADH-quinone oxidoreductase subunit G